MSATRVLVVEDNAIARKMVRVALEAEGYTVTEAEDGQTALALLAQGQPDLVVQDLKLPDIDGFEVVNRLRALPGGSSVPVIALSGFRSELEYARAASEFVDLLVKPVDPELLARVVRTHLRAPERASQALGTGRRVLLVDDDPMQLKLSALHLRAAGFEVTTACDGVEGLEVARRDPPDAVASDVLMPRLDGFRLCAALRREPALARVPVVLTSSAFVAEADAALARQAGADAFVVRTPESLEVIDALLAALRAPRPATAVPPAELSTERYAERMVRQLEQQVRLNATLTQRLAQRRAELAVLSAAASTVVARAESGSMMADVMHQAFNACGVSRGAVYLLDPDRNLSLSAVTGFGDASRSAVAEFFGQRALLQQALDSGEPFVIDQPPAGLAPVIVAGLHLGTEPLGAFWMEVETGDARPEEWLPFGRALATQFVQAIALSRAFADAATGREMARLEELRRQQLQIKDEFLSHVSHELRTPLTAMYEFTSILLDGVAGGLNEQQREFLGIVLRNARDLRSMIDDLLEAGRSETAHLSVRAAGMTLPDVVREVLELHDAATRNQGITVAVEVDDALPRVYADPARVRQIIGNLVGNAIKFTPAGGTITVRARSAADNGEVTVSVADTGRGIAASEVERVFEYMYQGTNSADLPRRGFGIGLHLCRDLVTRQGGRIWVDSTPGRGSTFCFTLPIHRAGQPEAP